MWRWLLALGALGALVITPPFALSYFSAYGMPGESPVPWLSALRDPLVQMGLLGGDPARTYDRYGVLYLATWVLALSGLAGLVHQGWKGSGRRVRRAWTATLGSLTTVALGIVGDYALPDDVDRGTGFLLTNVGFVGALAALPFLGWALRAEGKAGRATSWGVGLLGVTAVVGGGFLVGHIPSGPGLGLALAALLTAVRCSSGRRGRFRGSDRGPLRMQE